MVLKNVSRTFGGKNLYHLRLFGIPSSMRSQVLNSATLQYVKQLYTKNSTMKVVSTNVPKGISRGNVHKQLHLQQSFPMHCCSIFARNEKLHQVRIASNIGIKLFENQLQQYSVVRNFLSISAKSADNIPDENDGDKGNESRDKAELKQKEELKESEITKDWLLANKITMKMFVDNVHQRFMNLELGTVDALLDWAKTANVKEMEEKLGEGPGSAICEFLKENFPDDMNLTVSTGRSAGKF